MTRANSCEAKVVDPLNQAVEAARFFTGALGYRYLDNWIDCEGNGNAKEALLNDMDGEHATLEARRDKTRALKQGMMQQFLTGRVRLVRPSKEMTFEPD